MLWPVKGRENGHVTECHFNGGRKVMSEGQFNGGRNVMEVASLMEGEWSCYRDDHFNGGKMVRLQRWPVYLKEKGHVTEVVSYMEGE